MVLDLKSNLNLATYYLIEAQQIWPVSLHKVW